MTTASKARPRVKPERRVSLGEFVNGIACLSIATIEHRVRTEAKITVYGYFLHRLPADFGLAFRVEPVRRTEEERFRRLRCEHRSCSRLPQLHLQGQHLQRPLQARRIDPCPHSVRQDRRTAATQTAAHPRRVRLGKPLRATEGRAHRPALPIERIPP